MTNEEKAKEIANNNACPYTESHYEFGKLQDIEFDSYNECEESALDMAEWKDQQFKEYLKKKLECARGNRDFSNLDDPQWHDYVVQVEAYKEIINELFPQDTNVDTSDNDE